MLRPDEPISVDRGVSKVLHRERLISILPEIHDGDISNVTDFPCVEPVRINSSASIFTPDKCENSICHPWNRADERVECQKE